LKGGFGQFWCKDLKQVFTRVSTYTCLGAASQWQFAAFPYPYTTKLYNTIQHLKNAKAHILACILPVININFIFQTSHALTPCMKKLSTLFYKNTFF